MPYEYKKLNRLYFVVRRYQRQHQRLQVLHQKVKLFKAFCVTASLNIQDGANFAGAQINVFPVGNHFQLLPAVSVRSRPLTVV